MRTFEIEELVPDRYRMVCREERPEGTLCWTLAVYKTRAEAEEAVGAERLREAAPALLEAVRVGVEMRAANMAYFKTKKPEAMTQSLALEKRFDALAKRAIEDAAGIERVEQGGLF